MRSLTTELNSRQFDSISVSLLHASVMALLPVMTDRRSVLHDRRELSVGYVMYMSHPAVPAV